MPNSKFPSPRTMDGFVFLSAIYWRLPINSLPTSVQVLVPWCPLSSSSCSQQPLARLPPWWCGLVLTHRPLVGRRQDLSERGSLALARGKQLWRWCAWTCLISSSLGIAIAEMGPATARSQSPDSSLEPEQAAWGSCTGDSKMHWNMYYGHEGLFVGLAPVMGCYGKWHIDVESLKCSLGILTKTACFSLGRWSNREDNISFQLKNPDFSCFCFVFFCHCCCCCGKTTHPPGSASVGCRRVSHHLTISSGLSWMHPTSLHPRYCFDARVTCLLFFINKVGCCHLAPDLLQVRTETPARNDGDPKSAAAPCTQQGSGTLRRPPDRLLSFPPLNAMFICQFRWNHSRTLQEPARFHYSDIKGRHQSSLQNLSM